jgi:hypothetical protein
LAVENDAARGRAKEAGNHSKKVVLPRRWDDDGPQLPGLDRHRNIVQDD